MRDMADGMWRRGWGRPVARNRSFPGSAIGPRTEGPPARVKGLAGGAAIIALTVFINLLALVPPLAILLLFDGVTIAASERNVAILLLAVSVALVLDILLTATRTALIAWREARNEHSVGQQLFAEVLAVQPSPASNSELGSQADRFAAIGRVREFRVERLGALLLDLPFTFLFLIVIFLIGGWIAAVPAVILGCVTAMALMHFRAGATAAREASAIRGRQVNFALETLARIASIKSAAIEAPMMRRFERLVAGGARMEEHIARGAYVGQVAPTMIVSFAVAGVLALAIPAFMASQLGIGELFACVLLAVRASSPARRILAAFTVWHEYRLDQEQIGAALFRPRSSAEGVAELPRLHGAIKLEEVTIRSGDNTPLLDGVSVQIPAGATVGVTGAAGSGKTTLLMLIAGQRRPGSGRILLDGRFDPLAHAEESLLRQVAYVPDHAPIYAGTLLENITMFGGPIQHPASAGSAQSRDRAHDLAERLGLMPLAARLPLGFNTRIGPGSTLVLPPGTAQRIALARAFFGAPRILLLDLANAALDPAGDELFQRLLEEERGTCTMLIVSQRPSLLRLTDRVYTLSEGLLRSPSPSRHMSMVRQRIGA